MYLLIWICFILVIIIGAKWLFNTKEEDKINSEFSKSEIKSPNHFNQFGYHNENYGQSNRKYIVRR